MGKTFVEKILESNIGQTVFIQPDLVLSHDNTLSIYQTFCKMGGIEVFMPEQLMVVLDHNSPPANAKIANDYQKIRELVKKMRIPLFYDSGQGICHQLISNHATPGQIIVGSDSHTCTAGAFNTLAVGIDRTETAAIWKNGNTWLLVPESIKIILHGSLNKGVYAKDLSLYIIGMIGSSGANYCSIEFHGNGVLSLSVSERMTIANLASEMGAKNAVFPPDQVLASFYNVPDVDGVWADSDAQYKAIYEIDLELVMPLLAAPHQVDNIRTVAEFEGTPVHQGFIGTCTNGRLDDMRIAAAILNGQKVAPGFQLYITPASQDIYYQMINEGLVQQFLQAGAQILASSCGPCLGTGAGIPADGFTVISTANRNFKGRMGNTLASIYLASPAVVAASAISGYITNVTGHQNTRTKFPYPVKKTSVVTIKSNDSRKHNYVWDYSDVDNLNTDLMFAGKLTYAVQSTDAQAIVPNLLLDFDMNFSKLAGKGDIIIAGENFGCGSSREHPAVGFAFLGIKAIVVKSVNRIFFRSCINQGLLLIVNKQAVDLYKPGMDLSIDNENGIMLVGPHTIKFNPYNTELQKIINSKGLVNYLLKK